MLLLLMMMREVARPAVGPQSVSETMYFYYSFDTTATHCQLITEMKSDKNCQLFQLLVSPLTDSRYEVLPLQ